MPKDNQNANANEGKKQKETAQLPMTSDAQIASASARKLFIRLERKDLEKISALLALYPGEIPVYLHIPAEKTTFLAARGLWCDGSETCLKRLQNMIGAENTVLR